MILCPKCGSQNETGATFCDQCGNSLSGLDAGASVQPAQAVVAPVGSSNCPACGAAVIPGEAFCDNCGAAQSGAPVAAAPLVNPVVTPSPMRTPVTPVTPAPVAATLLVVSTGQAISLSGKTTYTIGREDPVSGIFPDVDTTNSGGDAAGVSRSHAQIVQQGDQWFLEDLNSVNGSFVNNQKLASRARQLLNPGDQIRLGKWVSTFQS